MDQLTKKLVQRLKGKRKSCNYDNKLRETHKHTNEVKNNDKNKRGGGE